jgi:hypothetical protein
MNKKGLFWGMAALVLALGLVLAGCDNGAQEIEGSVGLNNNKAPQVGTVTVTKTQDGQYYIVSWDAVAGRVSYEVWAKQDTKKTIINTNISGQNTYTYDARSGEEIPNNDLDKFSAKIGTLGVQYGAGSYSLGVVTSYKNGVVNTAAADSDVKWAAPITLGSVAATSVTLTKSTTTAGTFTVTFDTAAAPADVEYYYAVVLYRDGNVVGNDSVSSSSTTSVGKTVTFTGATTIGSYTAVVRISGAEYTLASAKYPFGSVTYYDITKLRTPVTSSAVPVGATW